MPTKFFLRSDRMAVKPEIKEPKPERFGNWNRAVDNWEQHIKSLPALDVDPDYLKTLRPGWFEGVEEYRITSTKGWVKTHKAMYDRFPDIQKQVLIVAPQPVAEKAGMRWVKASERLPQAGKPFFIRSVHTKSGGMMWGEEIGKMEELENVEWLDEQPATPHPVTGEDIQEMAKEAAKEYFIDLYGESWEMEYNSQQTERKLLEKMFLAGAASRPSDAVATQEHREEVERLKAREKELWIVLGEVLSEFDKTGTIPKGMYEEAKEIYKLPAPPTK